MADNPDALMDLLVAASPLPDDASFAVRKRGRPKLDQSSMAEKKRRVVEWGNYLRACREATSEKFTLSQAAREIGISSAKLLAAYEGVCFPPGDVIIQLAKLYRVPVEDMAMQFLRISNPEIFGVLFPLIPSQQGASDEVFSARPGSRNKRGAGGNPRRSRSRSGDDTL